MIINIAKVFKRNNLYDNKEIIEWWEKGRGLLNSFLFIYTLIYLSLIVFVFKNGWIVFLLPIIFIIAIILNLIFSFGLFFELVLSKWLRLKIDFNKAAPEIKKIEIVLIIMIVLYLSIFSFLDQ